MKIKIRDSMIFILILMVFLSGCGAIIDPQKNSHTNEITSTKPNSGIQIQDGLSSTQMATSPKLEETPIPTATETPEPRYELMVLRGYGGREFFLTYDPDLWYVDDSSGRNILELIGDTNCRIYFQWGHGMDPARHDLETWHETIGQTDFEIVRWFDIATRKTIVYKFISADDNSIDLSVENPRANPLSDYCIEQAREVISLSEMRGFEP